MFIELYEKFRVNVINIASYYPYDETRIMILTFKPIERNGKCDEILMCGNINNRDAVLIQLDILCDSKVVASNNNNEPAPGTSTIHL